VLATRRALIPTIGSIGPSEWPAAGLLVGSVTGTRVDVHRSSTEQPAEAFAVIASHILAVCGDWDFFVVKAPMFGTLTIRPVTSCP